MIDFNAPGKFVIFIYVNMMALNGNLRSSSGIAIKIGCMTTVRYHFMPNGCLFEYSSFIKPPLVVAAENVNFGTWSFVKLCSLPTLAIKITESNVPNIFWLLFMIYFHFCSARNQYVCHLI
jgi:hypothetical protein